MWSLSTTKFLHVFPGFSRQPDPEVKTSHVVLLVVIVAIIAVGFAVIIIIVCVAERDSSTKCNQFQVS